jgi:hypothetical protein
VFVADGVFGVVTAVVRKGTNQYAFYRGTSYVGQSPAVPQPPAPSSGEAGQAPGQSAALKADQSLDANLKMQNTSNSFQQIQRLQRRYDQPAGNRKGAAAGGFK